MSAALVLFSGCNKPEDTEEGQWYCYENGVTHTRLYIELKSGKADLIITAWGDRYKGPYSYNAEEGKLTINWEEVIRRGNAAELGDKSTLTSNIFNDWPSATEKDPITLEKPIVMDFKITGDKATCEFVGLNLELERKK